MKLGMICPEDLPAGVLAVCHALQTADHQAYLVGGCVRDHLLGQTPKDYDIATSAKPEEVIPLFSKVIPTGIRYGTVTVLAADMPIEVTTYRTDGNYSDGRRPDVVTFGTSIQDDLARRDFTINAMAFDLRMGIVDPFGGRRDLEEGAIRAVGNPDDRFREDALRMLRAIRLACQLKMQPTQGTLKAIERCALYAQNVSMERIREEMNKILLCDGNDGVWGIGMLSITKLMPHFLPELERCYGFDQQNPHHRKDVFNHTLAVVSAIPPVLHLRLAALLHDIAKPATFTLDENGVGHFYGHEDLGAAMACDILERLKYDRDIIDKVVHLMQHHMFASDMSFKGIRRFIARVGAEHIPDLLELRLADMKGSGTPHDDYHVTLIRTVLAEMQEQGVADPKVALAVNGNDVMEVFGISPGPRVGEVLRDLTAKITDYPDLNHRSVLLEILRIKAL